MLSERQLFLRHIAQTSESPLMLEIERAEGLYLYDTAGKSYMDLIAGISVSILGHRHPEVQRAIQKQLEKYWHTLVYGEFVLSPQVQLATLLSKNLPDTLNSVYFTNSGTEAIEGAMKLAKRVTGRKHLIAAYNAYHGSTQGAMSLNSSTYFTKAYKPLLPNIDWLRYNNFDDIEKITKKTAAVVIEAVQAEAGIISPKKNYLKTIRERCNETGSLLILDEVQSGLGRTGKLWAFCRHQIVPDILVLAKGLGGGMPIGAFIADKKLMDKFTNNPVLGHITTFGGHPVSCAAALATLQTILTSDLIEQVARKEKLFLDNLKHPMIKEIRSAGLWLAVELENFSVVQQVIQNCLKKGLLTDWFLFNDKCLRIAPPLTISEAEILKACKIITDALTNTKE